MPAVCRQTSELGTIGGMIYWIDAQLPPRLASWLSQTFNVQAYALRDLQLRDAEDEQLFQAARREGFVIISKDSDFVEMVLRLGTYAATTALGYLW
jgi:predicted nuclease of predicted toxin-antitoxin system